MKLDLIEIKEKLEKNRQDLEKLQIEKGFSENRRVAIYRIIEAIMWIDRDLSL